MSDRPIGIDLFAGAGGMSLGFEQAGFDIAAAVELDPIHASVHTYNFPDTMVLARSVVGLTGEELRARAGIGNRSIDVVFGGPPCQGFSLIGHRMLDDSRNQLVKEFVRLVKELDAKTFVLENVKGLTIGKQKMFLESVTIAFADAGYNVRLPWRVLNAANYGVPQDRQRLFLLGTKKGLRLPDYPKATTSPDIDLIEPLVPTPTCADALMDLPDVERFPELWESDTAEYEQSDEPASAYAQALRCRTRDDWHFGYIRQWDRHKLTSSNRTDHTPISKHRFQRTAEGDVEPVSRFFKLARNGLSNTLRAGTDSARGAFTSPRPIHFAHARCVTVREMARLHGYPDWFRFHVTKWHGAREIGNSVPPPLARSVATSIMVAIGRKATRPARVVGLGDAMLLSMNMGQAAAYWGVPVVIGKRDRKSGAHKRRQAEVESAVLQARRVS